MVVSCVAGEGKSTSLGSEPRGVRAIGLLWIIV